MWNAVSLLWTWNRAIDRAPYLLAGSALFAVKFAIDWAIAGWVFGKSWSPINYLIWPNDRVLRVFELSGPEGDLSLTILFASLPFIWTGVILSLHRLRSAGMPLALILLFFIPLVNLLFFLALAILPKRENDRTPTDETPRRLDPLRRAHRSIVRESYWRSGLVALSLTVPGSVLGVLLGAQVLQSYGFSLFIGVPFAVGMISVLIFGFSWPKPFWACLAVAMGAAALAGAAIVVVALEGVICLIMAAPIGFALAFLGGMIGYMIQSRPWLNDEAYSLALAISVSLPALMAAESRFEPEPDEWAVRTEVIVDAPPTAVWPLVIAFPPLPEPTDWFFRTGIAYPRRAEIRGSGVGAIRHCVFSTGDFVEPIEVWDAPNLLRFRVTDQPPPLTEWSPFHIHPPHLDHYLDSKKGQFELEPLPNGKTRLIGTTWYGNRMWPAAYWRVWSDYVIQRIHERVLNHIKTLAEAGNPS